MSNPRRRCRRANTRCAKFAYAGGGLAKGGQVTLSVDGKKIGEAAIPMTQAMVFSADDGRDVGEDSGAPVSRITVRAATLSTEPSRGAARHRRGGREFRSPRVAGGGYPHRHGTAVERVPRPTHGAAWCSERLFARLARRALGMGPRHGGSVWGNVPPARL